jgi:hypothetical protein
MSNKKQESKQKENTQPAKDKPNPYPLRDFNSEVKKPKIK